MPYYIKKYWDIVFVAIASFATHFILFGYPRETVFDEVHFGKFISGYFSGEYFFDIHPPLAKLLITGIGALGGYRPTIDFSVIGESFTDTNFIWLRLLPAIAGALLPIVIYYLCRIFYFSRLASFSAAMLIVLENSLLVQSRFILLDSLLLLFGFGSFLCYFLYRKYEEKKIALYFLLGSVILASFSLSIKWTGVSFIALIACLEAIRCAERKVPFKEWLAQICLFGFVPFIIYFLSFGVHFALLQNTGPGKDFMSPAFQKTLTGNTYENDPNIPDIGLFKKFVELNIEMYQSNKTVGGHPYGSLWYTWPLMQRPIYYWVETPKEVAESLKQIRASGDEETNAEFKGDSVVKTAKIYLLGNPFIYWFGSIAVLLFIFYLFFKLFDREEKFKKKREVGLFLLAGYLLNLLPFAFITRVMFLYHYSTSLIFSILILVFLLDQIQSKKTRSILFGSILLISTLSFLFFAPFTYGLPLTRSEQEARFWFKTWE